jgi:hypothetical protein
MKKPSLTLVMSWTASLVMGCMVVSAQAATNAAAPQTVDAEAKYARVIEGRAAEVLAALSLTNAAAESRVREALLAQYRALRAWHDANDGELKALRGVSGGTNAALVAEAKLKVSGVNSTLKSLHDDFIRRLSAELTSEQVDTVKDKLAYGKVRVTYDAYCAMLPELTADQKARILAMLKEAREEAMDAGSAEEKSAVFNTYKGRINNYLSSQGHDLREASRDWAQKLREARQPKTADPPAPGQGSASSPK